MLNLKQLLTSPLTSWSLTVNQLTAPYFTSFFLSFLILLVNPIPSRTVHLTSAMHKPLSRFFVLYLIIPSRAVASFLQKSRQDMAYDKRNFFERDQRLMGLRMQYMSLPHLQMTTCLLLVPCWRIKAVKFLVTPFLSSWLECVLFWSFRIQTDLPTYP